MENKTKEDKEAEMEVGAREEDVYSKEGREKLAEDGEIADWEEGFMEGAAKGGTGAKCRNCGKILIGDDSIIEKEIDNEKCRFCSDSCVNSFEKKQKER